MDYTKDDDYLYFSLQAFFVLFQFARIKKEIEYKQIKQKCLNET